MTETIKQDRLWADNGWTARVIKNPDDEGWAVETLLAGQDEPALVGPWTMGRDKKNPKPLDVNAFNTLVKTASEVIRRHEQHLHATLHKSLDISSSTGNGTDNTRARWQITLDIVPDEMEPHALLSAANAQGERVAQLKVDANFKLTVASATRWVDSGFVRPA